MDYDRAIIKIRKFYLTNGRLPSYQELCRLFRYRSKSSSYFLINKLIEKGILEKDIKGKLIPKRLNYQLPHLGGIRAGIPTDSDAIISETISLDEYLIDQPEATFVVTVHGDSMSGAGINDGDIAVINKNIQPKNGDIIVACIDGQYTLKYLRKNKKSVYLEAANQKYDLLNPHDSLSVDGVVVGVVRKYL